MKVLFSFFAVLILAAIAYAGVEAGQAQPLFGIAIPYAAAAIFLVGVIWRVTTWAKAPVPFRIPSTCGQQKSLPWIKPNAIDNPTTNGAVMLRMALEVFAFRSLFRNTKAEYRDSKSLVYGSAKWLWLAALAFHASFFAILIRHVRFFVTPVPLPIDLVETLDTFAQVGAPVVAMSGLVIIAAAGYLLYRRLAEPAVRYISLPSDYFPLFLILAIAISGALMRYIFKTDVVAIKTLTMGLVAFTPKVPQGVGSVFYIHLFLVSVLFAYFPFSKLMHMAGVFMSPTRNLANNSRIKRHINPWNHPVKVHTYDEYEEDFREVMVKAGIPVEHEPATAKPEKELKVEHA